MVTFDHSLVEHDFVEDATRYVAELEVAMWSHVAKLDDNSCIVGASNVLEVISLENGQFQRSLYPDVAVIRAIRTLDYGA
jgi:hypothetical protein